MKNDKRQRTIIVCRGIPASGKSTFAKEYLAKNTKNTVRLNKDDIRSMSIPAPWSREKEQYIKKIEMCALGQAIALGMNVIIDDTNLSYKTIQEIRKTAKWFFRRYNAQNNVNYIIVYHEFFEVPLEVCIARNEARGTTNITPEIIKQYYRKIEGLGELQENELRHIHSYKE